jgi:drug/metabolite transporter (DMT)-like permease
MNKNLILPPLFTGLLFTGSYIAGRYAIVDLGPITASLWRYVVALVFLIGLLFRFKTESLKVEGKDLGFSGSYL